jgi:hypothetical protein
MWLVTLTSWLISTEYRLAKHREYVRNCYDIIWQELRHNSFSLELRLMGLFHNHQPENLGEYIKKLTDRFYNRLKITKE